MKKILRKLRFFIGKLLFDYKKKERFDYTKINKIIFDQRTDKIGDALVLTHAIREIKNNILILKLMYCVENLI